MLAAMAAIATVALAYIVVDQVWLSKRVDEQKFSEAETLTQPANPSAASAAPDKSIAVLPFVDMSAERNQEYMSDGIAEEVLNLLVQVPDLKVIARTSSFAFKDQNIEISEIAKKLNVAHVLEGSVRKAGNKIRVTAQLVRTSDSSHLWSRTFDRQLTDIFKIQDQIAASVVAELKTTLVGDPPQAKSTNPETYALFLQAREVGRQFTKAGFERSNDLYQKALALDPQYVAAWEGLAANYSYQTFIGLLPVDQGIQLIRDATNKALSLEANRAPALVRQAWIAMYYDRDFAAAARHLEAALELEPANADVLAESGLLARILGRLDQAIAIGEHQVSLDPINAYGQEILAYTFLYANRWDDALVALHTVLSLNPNYLDAHEGIGEVLLQKGDTKSALAEMQKEVPGHLRLVGLSLAYHALDQKTQSDAALEQLVSKYAGTAPVHIAYVFAYRGETENAFKWLYKAATAHSVYLYAVTGHPMFNRIRSDPRWLPFLRQHGMAPEQLAAIKFDVALPQ